MKKNDLEQIFKALYNEAPPKLTKKELIYILSQDKQLKGAGFGDFMRKITSNTIGKMFNKKSIDRTIPYRKQYTNKTKNNLDMFNKAQITKLTLVRKPVNSTLINVLNVLSFGLFKKMMKSHSFDKMFHLSLVATLPSGKNLLIEKLAEINIDPDIEKELTELSEVLTMESYQANSITLGNLMENTRKFMGDKNYYDYDAFNNNCQNFILSILKGNNLNSPKYEQFIYQDITELYKELEKKAGYVSTISKFSTRMGKAWNKLTGAGKKEDLHKIFPTNYGIDTIKIIDAVAFDSDKVNIVGSSATKTTLYPGDFDLFETVKASNLKKLMDTFQEKVINIEKMKNVYLGDVKLGEYEEYNILKDMVYSEKHNKVIGYNKADVLEHFTLLHKLKVVKNDEYKQGLKLLVEKPTELQFNRMKHFFKFHILRWDINEISKGYKTLHGDNKISLVEALQTPALFKMDVIGFTRDKFMEFSIIYDVRGKNDERINNYMVNVKESLTSDIKDYISTGKYYKALKRQYSKLKYEHKNNKENLQQMNDLITFFNSDVGILNSVKTDIETILILSETENDLPTDKIINVINSFIYRLSNVYDVHAFLKQEKGILKTLHDIVSGDLNKNALVKLQKLKLSLESMINKLSYKYLKTV